MKLLYTVILFVCIIQWVLLRPLNASSNSTILTPRENISQFYDKEVDFLAGDICIKLKEINQEILKDETVQQSDVPVMQIFRKNMVEFQQLYTFKERFGMNASLAVDFSNMVKDFYLKPSADKESLYILQLIRRLGYDDLRAKYKTELQNFVSEKFLTKFEEIKNQILNQTNMTESESKLLKWVDFLKECREYECYFINLETFEHITSSPLKKFFNGIFRDMFQLIIIYSYEVVKFAKDALDDSRLSQLKPSLKEQLIANLQVIIKIHENVYDPEVVSILPMIYHYVLYKFDNYASISLKERQLITNIFNDYGYSKLHLRRNAVVEHDYLTIFENEKAALSHKDLTQLNFLLEVIERFRNATTLVERRAAFEALNKLLN